MNIFFTNYSPTQVYCKVVAVTGFKLTTNKKVNKTSKMPRKTSKRDQPSTSAAAVAKDKAKRSRRRIRSSSSEDGDEDFTPSSQATFRPSQFNTSTSAGADLDTLTNNMVKYFLNFSATKYPIKRPDVCKAINVPTKMFADVMKECAAILKDVYGLEAADVSDTQNSSVFIVHSAKNYSLTSAQYPPEQRSEITLLFIILSYIFMKNGDVQESKFSCLITLHMF